MSKKKYNKFNIFTKNGENRVGVETPYHMTIEEARDYFDCLCIGPY